MGNVKIGSHPPPLLDGHDDEQLNGYDRDEGLLIGTDCKEYQDINKHCIYIRGKAIKKSQILDFNNYRHPIINDHLKMAQQEDRGINWQQRNEEELYLLNEEENSYTGMNNEESRKARGAIEKFIYITAFFITKTILIYRDILLIISNFPPSLVFPEPANQQSKTISSVTKFMLYETYSLKKEEELHSLFVYLYFFIMFLTEYIERWADTRFFGHYVHIYGYYVTPLMRFTLDQIYEYHRKSAMESFELFIKRVVLLNKRKYKVVFNQVDQDKITLHNKLDITLVNKCINICVEYYALWYSLDETYTHNRISVKETFETFISRVMLGSGLLFKDFFTKDEKNEISLYSNLNLPLIKKCIDICTKHFITIIHPDISKEYLDIKITCKEFKDLRNNNFHNLPEPNLNVCNNYYQNLSKLEDLIKYLVKLNENRFPYSNTEKLISYRKLNFLLAKIPATCSELFIILIFIQYCYSLTI